MRSVGEILEVWFDEEGSENWRITLWHGFCRDGFPDPDAEYEDIEGSGCATRLEALQRAIEYRTKHKEQQIKILYAVRRTDGYITGRQIESEGVEVPAIVARRVAVSSVRSGNGRITRSDRVLSEYLFWDRVEDAARTAEQNTDLYA